MTLLIGLGALQGQDQPLLGLFHVGHGQRDQLTAPEGTRKADQQQCPVPDSLGTGESRHHRQHILFDGGCDLSLR
jgi:hypothetical protein